MNAFKEIVKMSLVKVQFVKEETVKARTIGVLKACTIGVVIVSTDDFCYVIAPRTKFGDYMDCDIEVPLPNGTIMNPDNLEFRGEIVGFYLINHDLHVREMEISEVPPVKHQTIHLFSYKPVGDFLGTGNVTFAGQDYIKHDCSCPTPVEDIKKDGVVIRTLINSGEVLVDADHLLLGIVKETDLIDRTVALNANAIKLAMMERDETFAAFRARIVAKAQEIIDNANSP